MSFTLETQSVNKTKKVKAAPVAPPAPPPPKPAPIIPQPERLYVTSRLDMSPVPRSGYRLLDEALFLHYARRMESLSLSWRLAAWDRTSSAPRPRQYPLPPETYDATCRAWDALVDAAERLPGWGPRRTLDLLWQAVDVDMAALRAAGAGAQMVATPPVSP